MKPYFGFALFRAITELMSLSDLEGMKFWVSSLAVTLVVQSSVLHFSTPFKVL